MHVSSSSYHSDTSPRSQVNDKGEDQGDSSHVARARVHVKLRDINDNRPIFDRPNIEVGRGDWPLPNHVSAPSSMALACRESSLIYHLNSGICHIVYA